MFLLITLIATSMAVAVVFGTDVFFTVVGRSALARTSTPAMLETMGRLHEVADRRMPVFGVVGIAGAALAAALSPAARPFAVVALALQLVWLAVYLKIAKPLNTRMTAAAREGSVAVDARAWQARWDAALVPRSLLMATSLIATLWAIATVH